MPSLPATFGRTGGSKAAGCLVYMVSTPFVAIFLALFLTLPIQLALRAGVISDETAKYIVLFVFIVSGLATLMWVIRDYRRRADFKVIIGWDRIVVQLGSRGDELPFPEVKSIRLVPAGLDLACVLVRQRGRSLRLSPEVAPFSLVRDALDETLIPELVLRLDRRLAAGERVTIRDGLLRSTLVIAGGLLRALTSVIMMVNPLGIPLAIVRFQYGILMMRQGWLGTRGGFVLDNRGLHPRSDGDSEPIPWDQLERIQADAVGLVLGSAGGRTFGVSALAEDHWPVLRWINARLTQVESVQGGGSDGDDQEA